MADNPRIEELRRRVEADPASIAFAALAEEYRRSGAYQDAIDTCRTGLQRHPSYLSARVTLGRALIEIGDYQAARQELEAVLKAAPENLAAIRGMADIHEHTKHAHDQAVAASAVESERHETAPAGISDWSLPPAPPPPAPNVPPAAAPVAPPRKPISVVAAPQPAPVPEAAPALGRLEAFLAAIHAARRAGRHAG